MQHVTEYETKDGKTVKKEPENKTGKKVAVQINQVQEREKKQQEDK